jgi:hypothetical protein
VTLLLDRLHSLGDDGERRAVTQDHWLLGFNFNVEEWFEGDRYETLAICRSRHPEGDW